MVVKNKDKIRGMFLGISLDDALGLPVETKTAEHIKEKYGRITTYVSAAGHKWFDGQPLGAWTDDTQLTLCVAEALLKAGMMDMDTMAAYHIKAYKTHTSGWGGSTREAIENLSKGIHWSKSGVFSLQNKKVRGFGNGVAMKAAPLGIVLSGTWWGNPTRIGCYIYDDLANFTAMTHRTSMAVSSCLSHVAAINHLYHSQELNKEGFINIVVKNSELGKTFFPETVNSDDITARFRLLRLVTPETSNQEIIHNFGKGGCYVFDSLPFTYAFFVRNPTIEALYDCASAGGDTDSNASMVGALLGVLYGEEIFPKTLVDGLQNKDHIFAIADAFAKKFG